MFRIGDRVSPISPTEDMRWIGPTYPAGMDDWIGCYGIVVEPDNSHGWIRVRFEDDYENWLADYLYLPEWLINHSRPSLNNEIEDIMHFLDPLEEHEIDI